jgi:hypothetical protein
VKVNQNIKNILRKFFNDRGINAKAGHGLTPPVDAEKTFLIGVPGS